MNRDDYPRCKTCKWYMAEERYGFSGVCDLMTLGGWLPPAGTTLALAFDPEVDYGTLRVQETFGCIQHAPKPES